MGASYYGNSYRGARPPSPAALQVHTILEVVRKGVRLGGYMNPSTCISDLLLIPVAVCRPRVNSFLKVSAAPVARTPMGGACVTY